ncbi:MAG: DNA mismatch repair protein MutH [Aeromonadales bacterium]|nr:DNA mismatch repair protein MutH [Aeromonadales bacterium]MDY2892012.1 DNA mismatch repair protein MutH [Succinivibrio sp.]
MKRNEGWHAAPPSSFAALTASLESIKGRTIADLAAAAGVPLPLGPLHGKGFQGELIERFLGASAPGLPIPDFPNLGCELKTVPLDERFCPLESTFICSAPLDPAAPSRFEDSILFHKISRVLFVFLVAPRNFTYQQRFVAGYRFWRPDGAQMAAIRADYDELMEMAKTGRADEITARDGAVVQMRPKAADGTALTRVSGPDGSMVLTRPRGFYMRRSFMESLLRSFGLIKA